MVLKVRQLKFIAEDIVRSQRLLESLREEVKGTLGCLINISEGLDDACYQVNCVIDTSIARGGDNNLSIRTSLLKKLFESKSPEARRLAARLLPTNLITNYRFDKDESVRAEVCKRLPRNLVAEVAEYFPGDYEIQYILEKKELENELHMYDEKRMTGVSRPSFQPELSDSWYRDRAAKFLEDYGTNIEYQWEETLVRRYCSSMKATNGVEVDPKKLFDALNDLIVEKEEEALLKDERKKVKKLEKIRESRSIEEGQDDLRSLLSGKFSQNVFINEVNKKFSIKESEIPRSIRKFISRDSSFSVPMKATIPGGKMNSLVEETLDAYVSRWNDLQNMRGEPLKLSWSVDPMNESKVSFSVVLR